MFSFKKRVGLIWHERLFNNKLSSKKKIMKCILQILIKYNSKQKFLINKLDCKKNREMQKLYFCFCNSYQFCIVRKGI